MNIHYYNRYKYKLYLNSKSVAWILLGLKTIYYNKSHTYVYVYVDIQNDNQDKDKLRTYSMQIKTQTSNEYDT